MKKKKKKIKKKTSIIIFKDLQASVMVLLPEVMPGYLIWKAVSWRYLASPLESVSLTHSHSGESLSSLLATCRKELSYNWWGMITLSYTIRPGCFVVSHFSATFFCHVINLKIYRYCFDKSSSITAQKIILHGKNYLFVFLSSCNPDFGHVIDVA